MKRIDNKNKTLYEAIMKDVAVIVKKHLNELSPATIGRAWQKKNQLGDNRPYDPEYKNLTVEFDFIAEEPLTIFDEFHITLDAANTTSEYGHLEMTAEHGDSHIEYLAEIDFLNNTIRVYDLSGYSEYIEHSYYEEPDKPGIHLFTPKDARRFATLLNKEYGFDFTYRLFVADEDTIPYDFRRELLNI